MKKFIAMILCFFITFSFSVSAYAAPLDDVVDIEQMILDQAAAGELEYQPYYDENGDIQAYMSPLAALTGPEVALLIAAGYGVYYAATNADAIYDSLSAALDAAAATVEGGAEYLANWWSNAKTNGSIALGTAQSWVQSAIADWSASMHNGQTIETPSIKGTFCDFYLGDSLVLDIYGNTLTYKQYNKDDGTSPGKSYTTRFTRALENSTSDGIDIYILTYYFIPRYTTFIVDGVVKNNIVTSDYHSYKNAKTGYVFQGMLHAFHYSTTLYYENPDFDTLYSNFLSLQSNSLKYDVYGNDSYSASLRFMMDSLSSMDRIPTDSVCPDSMVGGIGNVLTGESINDLVMPDINVGSIDAESMTLQQLQEKLISGEITWSQYWDLVGVGDISVPYVIVGDVAYPITDTGVSDKPITDETDKPIEVPIPGLPENPVLDDYAVNLTDFFPFCIPFDLYDFLSILAAEPETPVYTFMFPNPVTGEQHEFTIDLTPFDGVATIFRNMFLLLFVVGLMIKTRDLIRG